MLIETYLCDLCKKEVPSSRQLNSYDLPQYRNDVGGEHISRKKMDICDDCESKIEKFIESITRELK